MKKGRKTIFLLLFATIMCKGQAQEVCCYPNGTVWEELQLVEGKVDPEWYIRLQYTVDGDTLVNDVTYKRVVRQWMEGQQWAQYTQTKTYYLREENGLVYFLGKNDPDSHSYDDIVYDGTETLRYNFNWEVGGMGALGKGTLNGVSQMVLADGNLYDYDSSTKVIRTIGRIRDGILLPYNSPRSIWFALASFIRNGVEIYHADFPETSGIVSVETANRGEGSCDNADNLTFYDLSGRQVFQGNKGLRSCSPEHLRSTRTVSQGNTLPKGVYIQNGRKFVVK